MNQKAKNYHSGFVTIIGRPNVGKSSLMNRMIGEKIAIVSSKPQTTRSRIMGVLSRPEHQIVFLDTPGIHDPRTKLGEYMMHSVRDAMDGMDAVLVLFDVTHITENDLRVAEGMKEKKVPVILALNKIDLATPEQILAATAKAAEIGFEEIIPVSARTGDGVEELIKSLENHLPEGPLDGGQFIERRPDHAEIEDESQRPPQPHPDAVHILIRILPHQGKNGGKDQLAVA